MKLSFSLLYCIAIALIRNKVGLAEFDTRLLEDENVKALMSKIELNLSPYFDLKYPKNLGCEIELKTIDGRLLKQKVENPLGDPENPMDIKALSQKFLELTMPILGDLKARAVIGEVLNLDKASSISDLMEILR